MIVKCKNCPKEFEVLKKRGRIKRYCCPRCRYLFWKNKDIIHWREVNRKNCRKAYLRRKDKKLLNSAVITMIHDITNDTTTK